MAAPVVQSVEQIINELNPVYQGQIGVLQSRQAQLPGQFQAQRMGLEAQKVQGFNQINNQATSRGMSFSGIPLDEQADYLSTKFLPGMQQLQQQENDQRSALDEAMAKIDAERRLRAIDTRDSQQKRLDDYLAEERERAWQQQKFAAEQALQRQKMAQDRASQASQGVSLDTIIRSYLNENSSNGKVSRQVWENAAAMAKSKGLSFGGSSGFASSYWSYANHGNYKSGMEKYM